MSAPILAKYNQAKTLHFELYEVDGIDFRVDAVHASGDTKSMENEGTEANTTNGFTDEGTGYSLVLTATEMSNARITVYVVDQTGTKVWLDKVIHIETYGHASAEHAFDLDTASVAQTADNDTKISLIPTTAMRGTDSAATAANLAITDTAVDAIQTDLSNATDGLGAIKTSVDAIPTTAMRGTDSAALATALTTAQNDLDIITGASGVNLLTATQASIDAIEADTNELQADDVPTLISTLDAVVDTVKVDTAAILVDTGTDIPARFDGVEGATFSTATDSLESIRDRGDAAWTTGAGGSAPTVAQIRTEMDSNSTQLAAIVADTNELQGDWVNGGRLDLLLDAIPTTAMRGTDSAALATALATVDTNVDAIKVASDKLVFTKVNELDVNIISINDVTITGDGSATPFDV